MMRAFGSACRKWAASMDRAPTTGSTTALVQTLNTPVGSEDCLTLNIWRPASAQDRLPVIVFLHGGSAISGYTADPVYDGAALARTANAVVVTANYRLDVLGFMHLPQLHVGGCALHRQLRFAGPCAGAAVRAAQCRPFWR